MRKIMAVVALVVALGLLGGGVGVGVGSAPAGAGGFACDFTVSPPTLPPGGGTLTVTGTAPGSSLVQIYYLPVGSTTSLLVVGDVPTNPVTGFFQASFFTAVSGEVLVGVDDYAADLCVGTDNADANRPGGPGGSSTARRLPTTGASRVGTYVLTGLAALSAGLVLVVGARRRGAIKGRA